MGQEQNQSKPENNQQQAKIELEQIVNQLADQGRNKIEQIFGPIRETNVPQSELDKLFKEAGSLTHTELAQKCYQLAQQYPPDKIPEPFKEIVDKKNK